MQNYTHLRQINQETWNQNL